MTTGALIFAHNNALIDYTKLSIFAANRVMSFLDIPVSLVTDNSAWLYDQYPDHPFDKVIETPIETSSQKYFYDGALTAKEGEWKNLSRNQAYNLSPYDKTLVIDSDFIISSNILKIALDRDEPFQIYQKSTDLADWRDNQFFQRINPYSIPFYWATVFVFSKNEVTKSFFDLISYIKSNYRYFQLLYSIDPGPFRNDFAFSIAIHIMNGKTNGEFATPLPGSMVYIQDRDILTKIKDNKMQFLVEKENYFGEYTAVKTEGLDVHVMNKMSLSRVIDEGKND